MTARKRKLPNLQRETSDSPPRKTARLLSFVEAEDSTQQQPRELSVLSTNPEAPEAWTTLADQARARVTSYKSQNRVDEEKLAPSFYAFLEWLPEGGRESIARDIINAKTDEDLYYVFKNLVTGLAVPMKARSRTASVTESPHPKRRNNAEIVAATLDKPESRNSGFRDMCLRRDNYHCVISGNMDSGHWEKIGSPEDTRIARVEAAHIIPFAYASWDKSSEPPANVSNAWEVLFRCFPNVRKAGMKVEDINDISNGLSLTSWNHQEFGQFSIALKPTETENLYELKVFRKYPTDVKPSLPKSGLVQLTRAKDAKDLKLPHATLLDCHYRLAEILNASGMGEMIEKHHRDWEGIKETAGDLLKEDGATDIGYMLNVALWERVS